MATLASLVPTQNPNTCSQTHFIKITVYHYPKTLILLFGYSQSHTYLCGNCTVVNVLRSIHKEGLFRMALAKQSHSSSHLACSGKFCFNKKFVEWRCQHMPSALAAGQS